VLSAEQRFRAHRRAARRRAVRPALLVAAVLTALAAAGWAAAYSPLLRVTSVTVEGTSRLTVAQVTAAARIPHDVSLLLLRSASVRRRVAALPAVAAVAVERDWPHRVLIRVIERVPVAAVSTTNGRVVLLDRTGFAFAVSGPGNPGLPSLHVSGPPPAVGAADETATAGVRVWLELPGALRRQVLAIDAVSPDDVSLQLTGRRVVVWGSADQSATKATVLNALLARRAHVYDVSTPAVAVTHG
jgi:cell division protein FtsQ